MAMMILGDDRSIVSCNSRQYHQSCSFGHKEDYLLCYYFVYLILLFPWEARAMIARLQLHNPCCASAEETQVKWKQESVQFT